MPIPRPRPKLMAIGDSLAQGCRSLSVTADYCSQSWPARIAQAQDFEFIVPDFPRPILYDLEFEVRHFDTATLDLNKLRFSGIVDRLVTNFRDWRANPSGANFPCFDNLALAGARVYDLYKRSASSSAQEVEEIAAASPLGLPSLAKIGDLHIAINGRFTLNPGQIADFANFTSLDWVEARLPETLLVQIGHNHGLFGVGFEGVDQSVTTPGDPTEGDYFDQWATLADRLAKLPGDVKQIVVTTLPKVSAVANLRPQTDRRDQGYALSYEPVFIPIARILTEEQLRPRDASIRAANARIQQILLDAENAAGTGGRIKFLDVYNLLDQIDFKNSLDQALRVRIDPASIIDNRYLHGGPKFSLPFQLREAIDRGGFNSIDGMHLSGAGYAFFASEVMKLLGLAHDRSTLLEQGFRQDFLLSEYPVELDILIGFFDALRTLQHVGHTSLQLDSQLTNDSHLFSVLQHMAAPFTR
jgi:hypothetical protein